MSRDILLRGIAYKVQEDAFGGLSKAVLRKLQPTEAKLLKASSRTTSAAMSIKARVMSATALWSMVIRSS